MGFQERAYETPLARTAWLLELAEHWRERDHEFAEQLRTKARQLQSAEDRRRAAQPLTNLRHKGRGDQWM